MKICAALFLSIFVFIRAGVGGVWGLCGRGLSVKTLHCDAKLIPLFRHTVLLCICICVWFSCNIRVYEPYPIIYNLRPRPKPIMVFLCWFMCDAAVFRTTSLQKSQTLDIVKCTGFYCFAGFCFHRSFIKVIFHCATFLVCFLVDVGCVSAPTLCATIDFFLFWKRIDSRPEIYSNLFLPVLCARENKKRK